MKWSAIVNDRDYIASNIRSNVRELEGALILAVFGKIVDRGGLDDRSDCAPAIFMGC